MMSVEGPFLAAIIARLADPKFNLAAYGVAFSFAVLVEAPVIMIMSASTALVEDAASYRKLRNFTYALNGGITALMLVLILPPVFRFIAEGLIGLPENVADLTHVSLVILLPWPAAIGYRRFFQGLLIRDGRTRLVAYGTVIRLAAMTLTALTLFIWRQPAGAYLGAWALSAGVCGEAVAARLMARGTVGSLLGTVGEDEPLDYRRITDFYLPLAFTSTLTLAVPPLVTFFMGRARYPVESLAVLPVVNSLSFIFRSMGLSYQEVAITLLGKRNEHVRELGRFALVLGLAASSGLALIGFTPLARVWFEIVSGLTPELSAFAIPPTRILAVIPALSVLLSFQRAILMNGRYTKPITAATIIEVSGILASLLALTQGLLLIGATAAAIAFIAGRVGANAYLVPSCLRVVRVSTDVGRH